MMVMPEDGWEERREGWRAYYQSVHLKVMYKIFLQTPYLGQPRKKVIPAKRRKLSTILEGNDEEGKDTGQDLEEEERERETETEKERKCWSRSDGHFGQYCGYRKSRERERKIGRERERKKEEEKERKTCSDQGDCGALGQDWGAQKKTS